MRKKAGALLLCIVVLLLPGCGRRVGSSPRELFDRFAARYPMMPYVLYDSAAKVGEDGYLSESDWNVLLARPDGSDDREDLTAFVLATGTSFDVWYEVGFFLSRDAAGAEEVAGLLAGRCDLVRSMQGVVDVSAAEDPTILRFGNLTVLLALPDNEKAESVVRSVLLWD